MCENAVNARVPVAVPGARGSSPLLKKVAGAPHGGVWALY